MAAQIQNPSEETAIPAVTAIASYFGANRMLARHVGALLSGCHWVGIPFAGGMSEIPFIGARSIVANDLHPHLINLARVMADPSLGKFLYRWLRREIFHPDTLKRSQDYCQAKQQEINNCDAISGGLFESPAEPAPKRAGNPFNPAISLEWAAHYFICSWMGHGGRSGTPKEFSGPLSVRWDAGGGDSNTRFRSAGNSIAAWRRIFRRCNFVRRDGLPARREAFEIRARRRRDPLRRPSADRRPLPFFLLETHRPDEPQAEQRGLRRNPAYQSKGGRPLTADK